MSNLEMEKKEKIDLFSLIKKYKILFIIAAFIVLFLIAFNMGNSAAMVDLEKEKVSYDELVSEISNKEKDLSNLSDKLEAKKTELNTLETKFDERQTEFNEVNALVEEKSSIEYEIAALEGKVKEKQTEINSMDAGIKEKKAEFASISGQIQEKQEAPKQLPAGQFIVGKDIPSGRYKAVPAGGSGNFVVYSSSGGLKVNTILGGSYGEPEYVFYAEEGDMIELSTSAKFIPVE
jgi:septal ring factor EnvC (AmiA/AmiB activator)